MFKTAFIATVLSISCASTEAKAPPPDYASPQASAAFRELMKPSGVGGCIYFAIPAAARRQTLQDILASGAPNPDQLRSEVAKVASHCTGKPFDTNDMALVLATEGAFYRTAVAVLFSQAPIAIGQAKLDGAWRDASDAEKAPFYAGADNLLSGNTARPPAPTEVISPFTHKLGLDLAAQKPNTGPLLFRYYVGTAMSERGEAALLARGVPTPPTQDRPLLR